MFRPIFIAGAVILGSVASIAQTQKSDPLVTNAYRIADLVERTARSLDQTQRQNITKLLRQIRSTIQGQGAVPCSEREATVMQSVFMKLKAFAYDSNGVNLSSNDSTKWAEQWMQSYACEQVDAYMSTFKSVRAFAYDSNGINMSTSDSISYALEKVDRTCQQNVDYKTEGKKFYDFAYSQQGLNMSSTQASQYARAKMEEKYLNCPHN